MPVRCPQCGRTHDVAHFEEGKPLNCDCGFKLEVWGLETVEDLLRFCDSEEERHRADELKSDAENICRMILDERCPKSDIDIAREELRDKVSRLFPRKTNLYEMIYEARFKRLWEQFRSEESS